MKPRWVALGSVFVSALAFGAVLSGQANATAGPPTVTGVSPAVGFTKGGNVVSVAGSGLSSVTKVSFGSATSTKITHTSSTLIQVTAPKHSATRVDVRVTSSSGSSNASASDLYYFVAGAPRLTWSKRALVHGAGGTDENHLRSLSCASSTHCVLISLRAHSYTWNGHVISEKVFDADPTHVYDLVSCPTTTFCMTAGTTRTTAGPTTSFATKLIGGTHTRSVTIGAQDERVVSLSCPTTKFCVAVQQEGRYSIYRDGHWSAPRAFPGAFYPNQVGAADCPTETFCLAVASNVDTTEETFNGQQWSAPRVVLAGHEDNRRLVSCTQPTYCVASVRDHAPLIRRGSTWGQGTLPGSHSFVGIGLSCASVTFCVEVSTVSQRASAFDGAASANTPSPVSAIGVSCPTDKMCMSVGLSYLSIGRRVA